MSKSVSPPWLLPYLTTVAETAGGNLISVEPHPQSKKVQLVKFLTLQLPDKDNWIWVVISDMKHTIPARFSKEAMDEYRRHPIFGSNPVSSYKTALMQIKHFKPSFARIPRGPGNEGLTQNDHLFLEIDEFDLKGSFGDQVWGRPMDVEAVEDMKLWTDGIRAGGGGGNVLKLRKEEREQASTSDHVDADPHSPSQRPESLQPVTQAQQLMNGSIRDDEASRKSSRSASPSRGDKSKKLTAKERYMRRWRAAALDYKYNRSTLLSTEEGYAKAMALPGQTFAYFENLARERLGQRVEGGEGSNAPVTVPEAVPPRTSKRRRGPLDMSSSPSRHSDRIRSSSLSLSDAARPRTPSAWSPSVHGGSQLQHSDTDEERPVSPEDVTRDHSSPLFRRRRHTNGQSPGVEQSPELPIASLEDTGHKPKEVGDERGASEPNLGDLPPSSPPRPTSSFRPPTPAQRYKPSSSFFTTPLRSAVQPLGDSVQLPHNASQAADLTGSLPTPTSSPASPVKRSQRANQRGTNQYQHHLSDQGRVLVPNSDTSGTTASQPNPSQPLRISGLPSSQPLGDGPLLDPLSQLPSESQVQSGSQEDSQARSGQSLSYTNGSQSQEKDASQAIPRELPQPSTNEDDVDAIPSAQPEPPTMPLLDQQDLLPSIDAIRTDNDDDDDDDATESEGEEDQLMSPAIPMVIDIEALKQEEEEESQEQPQDGHLGEFDTDDERVDDDVRMAIGNGTDEDRHAQAPRLDPSSRPERSPPRTPLSQSRNLPGPPPSSQRSILQGVADFASSLFSGRLSGNRSSAVNPTPVLSSVQASHPEPTANAFHDVEAWREPTFKRRRAESSRQGSSTSDKPVAPTASNSGASAEKRVHSSSSEELKPSAPRGVKRRRMLRPRSSVNDQPPRKRIRRSSIPIVVSSSPEPSPPPSPRVAVASTSEARSKEPSGGPGQVKPPLAKSVGNEVAKTAGPSRRRDSRVPPPAAPRHIDLRESLSLSTKQKGKRPMRPSTSFVHEPAAAAHKPPKSTTPVPKVGKGAASERPSVKPKLDGFKLDLSMKPNDLNGMGVTWPQLDEFLLAVGRSRYKAKLKNGS